MTPEERAAAVTRNSTGPINVTRYACNALESDIASAIREAVAEEREACARAAYDHVRVEGANLGFAERLYETVRRSRSEDRGAADQGQQEADAHQHGNKGEENPSHLVERLGDAAVVDQPPKQPADQADDDEVDYQQNQGGQGNHPVAPVWVRPTAEIIADGGPGRMTFEEVVGIPPSRFVGGRTRQPRDVIQERIDAAVAARTEEIIALAEAHAAKPNVKHVDCGTKIAAGIRKQFLPAKGSDGLSGWSKAQPAESGYYWWRGGAGVIRIVEFYAGLRPGAWWLKFHGEEKEYPAAECEGEWAGPIYPPREADHAKP